MMKLGSGTDRTGQDGTTTNAVRTDRRECRNSYVDAAFELLKFKQQSMKGEKLEKNPKYWQA